MKMFKQSTQESNDLDDWLASNVQHVPMTQVEDNFDVVFFSGIEHGSTGTECRQCDHIHTKLNTHHFGAIGKPCMFFIIRFLFEP